MKNNKIAVFSIIAGIVNLIASIIFITTLPDIVPTHFDMHFRVDSIGSKYTALFLAFLPLLISLGMLLELKLRKKDYANRKVLQIMMVIMMMFFIPMNWITLFTMRGEAVIGAECAFPVHPQFLIVLLMGLLFIGMGNYFPTIAQNATLGIKTSWTLKNEQCWKLTHRFGGKVLVIAGLVLVLSSVIFQIANITSEWLFLVFFTVLMLTLVIVTVYSYMHRNDE